jgi:ABC-type polysaccharide/polyol phosphate export permease
VVLADVLWSVIRSTLVGLGVALGGCIVVGFFPWAAILLALPIVALTATIAALLGLAIVSKSRSFDDISIYEPIMASIFVFSGVFAAASNFPVFIQWFMKFQPIYHGIQAVRPLFMAGNVQGLFTLSSWLHAAILLVAAVAIYPFTYTLFKKRLIT